MTSWIRPDTSGLLRLPRRGFLQIGALSALGITSTDYLRNRAAGAVASAKSKSAILVFLSGGPSHHDTFDPKPDAPAEIRGEFNPIQTTVPGVHVSSQLPLLANQMQRLATLRAVTHRQAAHEPGVAYMTTGNEFRPGADFPGVGAVVSHQRQDRVNAYGLPPHIAMPSGSGGGYLGPSFSPFTITGDPNDAKFRVDDIAVPAGLSERRFLRRRELFAQVNEEGFRQSRRAEVQKAADRYAEQAYDIITSSQAQQALNLSHEKDATRVRFGRTPFGQRLLLARRLVETGVPFVTVTDAGWDDHLNIFPGLKQRLPNVDRGLSALLIDLAERGLLDQTLVIVMGEFGRTPKINPNRGRDHWANAFSVVVAGGGVRGGQVIGASDREGAYTIDRPVTPEDLTHSIFALLGIDAEKYLPSPSGREIQIVRDGKLIPELTG